MEQVLTSVRFFVSNYDYNVFTKNRDGSSVYNYVTMNSLFSTSPVAQEMSQTVLQKLQNEIRVLKQFLFPSKHSNGHADPNHPSRRLGPCPFMKRVGLTPDMQRNIKYLRFKLTLESWKNSSNVYKLMALSCSNSWQLNYF